MKAQTRNHSSFAAIEGAIGLAAGLLVLRGFLFARNITPLMNNIHLYDALFGVSFILIWQFINSLLHFKDLFKAIRDRMRASGLMASLLMLHMYFLHHNLFSISMCVRVFAVLFAYQLISYIITHFIKEDLAARNPSRVLILGSGPRANKAWREIRTRSGDSINLLGFMDDRSVDQMSPDVAKRYLGGIDSLSELLVTEIVDTVLIAMPIKSCYPIMQRAIDEAQAAGVKIVFLNDIFSSRSRTSGMNDSVLRDMLAKDEGHQVLSAVKRALDIGLALFGLVIFMPLLLVIALAIKVTSPGPAIFVQKRYGYRRRLFTIFKFRSMVANAEALMPSLESMNELDGPIFKLSNDPRVTPLGAFLRKTSLDELPQLLNVLCGDMSLVGPRPMSIRDVSLMSTASLMRRFSVRPGMTGLWQVSGRSSVGFDHWIKMDNKYIDRWSLSLDFKILVRTFFVIFKRSGAM